MIPVVGVASGVTSRARHWSCSLMERSLNSSAKSQWSSSIVPVRKLRCRSKTASAAQRAFEDHVVTCSTRLCHHWIRCFLRLLLASVHLSSALVDCALPVRQCACFPPTVHAIYKTRLDLTAHLNSLISSMTLHQANTARPEATSMTRWQSIKITVHGRIAPSASLRLNRRSRSAVRSAAKAEVYNTSKELSNDTSMDPRKSPRRNMAVSHLSWCKIYGPERGQQGPKWPTKASFTREVFISERTFAFFRGASDKNP